MEKNIMCLSPDMTVENAATIMIEKEVYYCPVKKNGKLVGVVTKKDIVKAIAKADK
jgi:predicted transcriptional regulator